MFVADASAKILEATANFADLHSEGCVFNDLAIICAVNEDFMSILNMSTMQG